MCIYSLYSSYLVTGNGAGTELRLPGEGPDWVGHVKEDAALAAHVLAVAAGTARAGDAVHGAAVGAALRGGVPLQPDVAVLAPAGTPAVPDDPVVSTGCLQLIRAIKSGELRVLAICHGPIIMDHSFRFSMMSLKRQHSKKGNFVSSNAGPLERDFGCS